MKKIFTTTILFSLITFLGVSQESGTMIEKDVNTGFSVGMQLNQYQKDFGIGLQLTSPFIGSNDIVAFRIRGNYQFLEHLDTVNVETTWTPYNSITFGTVISGGIIKNMLKLYAEAGAIMILPSSDFSTESFNMGGFGLFGFEFFMDHMNTYFIEIGGIGSGATADKIPTKPIYSNGFMMSVGYRMTF